MPLSAPTTTIVRAAGGRPTIERSRRARELVVAPGRSFLCTATRRAYALLRDDFIWRGLDCLDALAKKKTGPVPLIVGYVDRNITRPGRALSNAAAVFAERGKSSTG